MKDGYTEAHVILQTYLTEPQGKLKNYRKHVVRNVVKDGYTEAHVILQTYLTEPQGKLKECEMNRIAG